MDVVVECSGGRAERVEVLCEVPLRRSFDVRSRFSQLGYCGVSTPVAAHVRRFTTE
jgi:hypothetical protein